MWHRCGRGIALAVVLLLCALPACTSKNRGPETSSSPAQSSPAQQSGENDGRSEGTTSDGRPAWYIRWIVELGPGTPRGNHFANSFAYWALLQGDCEEVVKEGEGADAPADALYRGVGSACLAAFENRGELWKRAKEDLETVAAADRSTLTCYDRSAYALLHALVEAHQEDPDRVFVKQAGRSALPTPCVQIEGIEPRRGSIKGGYQVTLTGVNFPDQVVVHVNFDLEVPARSTAGGTRISFQMPAVEEAEEGLVWIEHGNSETAIDFQFDESLDEPSEEPTEGSEEPSPSTNGSDPTSEPS